MHLVLWLIAALPQDYINLVMEGKYPEAIQYCEKMEQGDKGYSWLLEKADIYFYMLDSLDRAEAIYQDIIKTRRPKDGYVHYRLAQVLERKEDYLGSARRYEIVATQYRKPPLDSFSLVGVERCFKKNYQDYVATVDGYRITRLELDERIATAGPFGKKDERAVLDQMIIERLLYTNALKHDVQATPEYLASVAAARRAQLLEEVKAVDVYAKAQPTEKELKAYYQKNRETYKVMEEVRAREIVVDSLALAQALHDSLTKDIASFDTLVKLYSTSATKSNGGHLGIINRGAKPPVIEQALFAAKPKVLTDIVAHDGKYMIFYVTEHKPERYRSFDEMKSQIEAIKRSENVNRLDQALTEGLKAKARIEIFEDRIADTLATPETVVAVVNGRPITRADVESRNAKQPQIGRSDMGQPGDFRGLLDVVINEELRLERGYRLHYYINDTYFTKVNDARRVALDQGLFKKIVLDAVTVDTSEARKVYSENREDYKIPETVRPKEIVVYSRELAQEIHQQLLQAYGAKSCLLPLFSRRARIDDPAVFDSLVQKYSVASTKSRNGDVGPLRRGVRPKEYEDAAFGLPVGGISDVFMQGDSSYTILTVTERKPESYRPYLDVEQAIMMNIRREKQGTIVREFLDRIRTEAAITIHLPEPAPVPEADTLEPAPQQP